MYPEERMGSQTPDIASTYNQTSSQASPEEASQNQSSQAASKMESISKQFQSAIQPLKDFLRMNNFEEGGTEMTELYTSLAKVFSKVVSNNAPAPTESTSM